MDAGIIASFKCHFRKHQLRYAIDQLENGKHPYKVDQLTAMRWCRTAWMSLSPSVFINCWRHTGLLSPMPVHPIETSIPIDDELQLEYDYFVQTAGIQSAISLQDFVNPIEEQQPHHILTDDEILEMSQTVDEDIDQEQEETEVSGAYAEITKNEQLRILAQAISICEVRGETIHSSSEVLTSLLKLQRDIRWEIQDENRAKVSQTSLLQYFQK